MLPLVTGFPLESTMNYVTNLKKCSDWFDRDTPDEDGDNELIGMPGIPQDVVQFCPMETNS